MYCISGISELSRQKSLLYIYENMLVLSVCIGTCPILPNALKKDVAIRIIWNISIFYILIFCNNFFVMLSNFSPLETVSGSNFN